VEKVRWCVDFGIEGRWCVEIEIDLFGLQVCCIVTILVACLFVCFVSCCLFGRQISIVLLMRGESN